MDILPASTKSDWWTVLTDNNPIKGPNLKDNINLPAFEKLQAQLVNAKTVPKQIELWQAFLKNPANINEAGMPIAKKALNTWMTDGKMPSNVQAALSKNPLAPLPALAQAQLTYDKTDPTSVKNYETALKDTYGNLKKADGTPEFTPAYLESVAAGTIPQDTFDTRINNIAVKAATADLKAQGISLADVGGAEGLASSGKLAEYLNDSTKLASAYTSTPTAGSTVTGGAGNDTVPNEGITALGPYSGSISEVNTPAKMKQAVDNYDPNKGVYRAPSLDASGKLVANSTSPYSNILNGMLSGYKNPYAADYTNQLKMPETPDLTNIKKSFENNPTSKDLLKLANTAGQPYDPNAQTSLSPALSKIYQPSITNSAGKATKPGAPDTTNTTLPVVPKAGEPIVTDTSAGKLAAEKLAAEKLAAEKLAAEKLAAGKMKWVQDLQNSSNTPVDYYTKLANNTLYSDLASTGKAALESYKSLPAVAPEVAKSTYLQEAQTSSKTPVEYYTKLANSTAYPDLQAAGQSGLAALNAQQNAPVTTPITQQPLGAPQPVTIDSSAEQARKALGTPQPVTIDSSAEQARKALGTPQQFTLTSPNQPQSVTLGSGVAGVVDPSVVSKSNLNTDASSAYGTGIVPNLNQQAQAASVPFTSAQQVVDLQKLQNTPGITAEQYYAALAANPTYAAAGQSGIAALQNKPAPIVPAAPQGTPQTFTLT
jgi:hypothetical protein